VRGVGARANPGAVGAASCLRCGFGGGSAGPRLVVGVGGRELT